MVGIFYFVLFLACAALVKFCVYGLIDYFGVYPFIPLLIGIIIYGYWYEQRARRAANDLDCSPDS